MTAREDILSAIRARLVKNSPRPSPYRRPQNAEDIVTLFMAQATRSAAEVRRLTHSHEVPGAVAEILRARNMKAAVHMPKSAIELRSLPWEFTLGLVTEESPPGPDDAAVSLAPLGIAETGTLAFPSKYEAPASWHFRPGLEIAVIRAKSILPDLESAVARVKREGRWPSTLNLVTGPSRTGDIEQTLELGAHGPKAVVVLVVGE